MEPLFGAARGDRTIDVAGIATAIVLLGLARWLLPVDSRPRAKLPLSYLLLSFVFGAASLVIGTDAGAGRVLHFFYTFFLLASSGRSLVLLTVDVVFGRRTHRAPPRIFRDLTQAVVYVIVLMLTLRAIGVEPGSLLTTSALLTAVLGLALQDTLGNMVSGLALQMQRPFEVGDWIQFEADPRQIGRVTEVNWRATTVITNDLVEVIVPNAMLAKAPIRNYSRPSPVSRRLVTVQGPYGVSPKRVQEAILGALANAPGVLTDPAPWVQTRSFDDSGIQYGVHFFTNDFANRDVVDGRVRDRVWYALQRAGIQVPFPVRNVYVQQVSDESVRRDQDRELERREHILGCVDFLDVLPRDAHRALVTAARVRLYAPEEIIVRQGETSTELFVIDRGEVVVEIGRAGSTVAVAHLGARKFFGEMGLLTGEARAATVRAVTECELLVIEHEAFKRVLAERPDVVGKMSELLAVRQAELEQAAASKRPQKDVTEDRSRRIISQIKDFFKL